MVSLEDIPRPEHGFYVLVTGANSGLGLGTGCRLIDEFLETRPQDESLVLITTTRTQRKGDATVEALQKYLQKTCSRLERSLPGITMLLQRRVHFRSEILDLTNILSIQKLSKRLRDTTPKLNVVICNAGIGGWDDLYWGKAVWSIATKWVTATTWPTFKKSGVGWVTKPQIPDLGDGKKTEEPALGEVFAANVFGHYLLGHYLAPLLARHARKELARGRMIWVSSGEAYTHALHMDDIQGMRSTEAYESTKRLTDLIAINSRLPSSATMVDQYVEHAEDTQTTTKPRMYVTHPGVVATTIFSMNFFLDSCMWLAFFIARWLGSPWHVVTPYKGAVSMVWLALAKQSTLDTMEEREGVAKWGSACNRWGEERVERTEVEGWGLGGILGEKVRKWGRSPHAQDLTKENKAAFEETGKKCWEEMEKLRLEWEKRLDDAGVGISME